MWLTKLRSGKTWSFFGGVVDELELWDLGSISSSKMKFKPCYLNNIIPEHWLSIETIFSKNNVILENIILQKVGQLHRMRRGGAIGPSFASITSPNTQTLNFQIFNSCMCLKLFEGCPIPYSECKPQKSHIDTTNGHTQKKPTFSKATIILGIQPLVFGGVSYFVGGEMITRWFKQPWPNERSQIETEVYTTFEEVT